MPDLRDHSKFRIQNSKFSAACRLRPPSESARALAQSKNASALHTPQCNLQILEENEAVAGFYTALGYSVEKRISMGKPLRENITDV